jgi:hypothetical protein
MRGAYCSPNCAIAHATKKSKTPRLSKFEDDFAHARKLVAERARGKCEGRVAGVCTGALEHVHHRQLRSAGGDNSVGVTWQQGNLVAVCGACHTWAHGNPEKAYELDLLKHAWE